LVEHAGIEPATSATPLLTGRSLHSMTRGLRRAWRRWIVLETHPPT